MRIYNKDLRKAWHWVKNGHFNRTIRFLEPKVPLFLEDPFFYALLGRACLESGDLGGADFYYKRCLQADPDFLDAQQGLAVLALRKKDVPGAVRCWLGILEKAPKDPCARGGLSAIKKISDTAAQEAFLRNLNIHRYLPSLGMRLPRWFFPLLVSLLFLLTLFYFRGELKTGLESLGRSPRPGAENLRLQEDRPLTAAGGEVRYLLRDDQVQKLYRQALKSFHRYEDNQARINLNTIKSSNASPGVKSQALILESLLNEPEINTLKGNISLTEVSLDPWLYQDCWVLWRGQASNVAYGDNLILFDFLVGYESGEVLEGLVPVQVPFPITIQPQLPLELLGKIIVKEGRVTLQAKTLHFLRN